jgi:hypothetical protein
VKILNRVGGAFLLLVLVAAVVLGFQTPTGRQIWTDISQAVVALLRWLQQASARLIGSPFDGHGYAAIGAAAVLLVLILIFLKKPIPLRVFELLLVLSAVVAFVLWNPSVIQSL